MRAYWLLGIAISLPLAQPALSSPQDVFGYGPRSMAMGATGAASARDYEAVYSNPALLSLSTDSRVDLGMMGAVFDLHAGRPLGSDGLAAGILGGVLPIPLPAPLDDRFVLGFGFLTPFDLVVRSRILYPETPQFLLTDRVQSVAAQVGLGAFVTHGVRVGVGFEVLAALAGSVVASVDASGRLGAVVEDTLVAAYAPVAGVSVDLPEDLRVGLALHGALVGRFDVRIDIRDLGQITVPPIFVSGTAQYDPLKVELEFARVAGILRGAIGVAYRRYSDYPGLAEATVRCPLDVQTFDIPSCAALKPADPDFADTLSVRGGAELAFEARPGVMLLPRAGYFFESAAAPEQTDNDNVYEEARSHITLGYGVDIGPPVASGLRLDAFAQLGFIHGRTHQKAPPFDAGHPQAVAVTTGGMLLAGGTTLGVAF